MSRRYIARGVPSRQDLIDGLTAALPEIEWCIDRARDPMGNMAAALLLQGDDDGAVHLEDDVALTSDFRVKVEEAIAEAPDHLVQMFSIRPQKDLTVGSRWEPGRTFLMAQCFYVPPGMAVGMAEHVARTEGNYLDSAIAEHLRDRGERYWLHVPSLVQHLPVPSTIGPRSTARQSPTFVP